MSSEIAITLAIVSASGILIWLLRTPADSSSGTILRDDIDIDELMAAEEEVQDLDAFTQPEEADEELRDWGPGAPP
jgi:hypothetical protein